MKHKQNHEKIKKNKAVIYDCIADFLLSNGYSPSVRELCDLTEIKSTATVKRYLEMLVTDGLITMKIDSPRTICVKGIRYVDERRRSEKI